MRPRTAKWAIEALAQVVKEIRHPGTTEELDGDTWNWALQALHQIEKEAKKDEGATIADVVDGRVTLEFPADQIPAVLSAVRAGKRSAENRGRNTKSEATAARTKEDTLALTRLAISLGGLLEEG